MLSRLYGVLLPFFVSFLLAWLLDPLVNFIQHKCRVKFRGLSVAITLILFIGLLSLAVYLIIPAMGREVKAAAVAVEQYFAHFDADKYFTPEQQEKIRDYALRAFRGLGLRDLSRVDFFLTAEGEILLNEINTFPGMTPISMVPKMMEHRGDSMADYLRDRISTALKKA